MYFLERLYNNFSQYRQEGGRRCEFWQERQDKTEELENVEGMQPKMAKALSEKNEGKSVKGNRCKTLGDCIIALEAMNTEKQMVCTTNVSDFKPICDYIGVEIIMPEKSI